MVLKDTAKTRCCCVMLFVHFGFFCARFLSMENSKSGRHAEVKSRPVPGLACLSAKKIFSRAHVFSFSIFFVPFAKFQFRNSSPAYGTLRLVSVAILR